MYDCLTKRSCSGDEKHGQSPAEGVGRRRRGHCAVLGTEQQGNQQCSFNVAHCTINHWYTCVFCVITMHCAVCVTCIHW